MMMFTWKIQNYQGPNQEWYYGQFNQDKK